MRRHALVQESPSWKLHRESMPKHSKLTGTLQCGSENLLESGSVSESVGIALEAVKVAVYGLDILGKLLFKKGSGTQAVNLFRGQLQSQVPRSSQRYWTVQK